jgi:diadenosine tetraphosphate (Ap4A) HIT family hydrolase
VSGGQCDDSRLCAELGGEVEEIAFHELCRGDPPTRILHESDHFAVLLDLAPLVEGHLLVVPKWHAISFGQVPPELWSELEALLSRTLDITRRFYGPALVLEHGSSTTLTFSACVSHAHWHVVPVDVDLLPTFAEDGLKGDPLNSLRDLVHLGASDSSYILYFRPLTGDQWVFVSGLSKRHQYLRVVIAEQIGIPDPEWDWGHTQRLDLLRSAYLRLSRARWAE